MRLVAKNILTFSVFLVFTAVPVVVVVTSQDCENEGGTGTGNAWLEVEEFIPISQEWLQSMIWFRRWASQYLILHTHLSSEENVAITDQYVECTANMVNAIITVCEE
jgi:hypothetical protein